MPDSIDCEHCGAILATNETWCGTNWELLCQTCAIAQAPEACPECRGWGCKRRCRPLGDRSRTRLETCEACGGEG